MNETSCVLCLFPNISNLTGVQLAIRTSELHSTPGSSHVAMVVMCTLGALVTFIGTSTSLLIVMSISTCRELRTYFNSFVASLAIRDFLMIGWGVPLFVVDFVLDRYPLGSVVCRCQLMIMFCLGLGTVLELTNIAMTRYVKLCCSPSIYFMIFNRKVTILLLLLSWGVSFMLGIPPSLLYGTLDEENHMCFIQQSKMKAVVLSILIVVAAAVTVFCYTQILRKICIVKKNLQQSTDGPSRRRKMQLTIKKSCRDFSVFTIYIFLLLPFVIVNGFGLAPPRHLAWDIAKFLSFMNNFTNSIIYGLFNSQLRDSFGRLLRLRAIRRRLFPSNTVHPFYLSPISPIPRPDAILTN